MARSRLDAAVARLEVLSGLRRWAEGSLTDQAAVELLAAWSAGCLIRPGAPWMQTCRAPGFVALDGDALATHAATRTGDEARVLLLAAALVNGDQIVRRWSKTRRAVA